MTTRVMFDMAMAALYPKLAAEWAGLERLRLELAALVADPADYERMVTLHQRTPRPAAAVIADVLLLLRYGFSVDEIEAGIGSGKYTGQMIGDRHRSAQKNAPRRFTLPPLFRQPPTKRRTGANLFPTWVRER